MCGYPLEEYHWDRSQSRYTGHPRICAYQPTEHSCQCESTYILEDNRQDDVKEKLVLYALVASGFVIGFWAPCVYYAFKEREMVDWVLEIY